MRSQLSALQDKLEDMTDENKHLRQYVDQLIQELMKAKKSKALVRASMGLGGDKGDLGGTPSASPFASPLRGKSKP